MKFRKNVGRGERIMRIGAGTTLILVGAAGFPWTAAGWSMIGLGAAGIVTGLFRYCPACAIAGRRSCDS